MKNNNSNKTDFPLAVVVLAAGKGTRMKDPSKAKVMYEILGKPMIYYVLDLSVQLNPARLIVIVGYQREKVIDYLQRTYPDVEIVIQADQLGTGHAVMQAEKALSDFWGNVIILSGDVPLLSLQTVSRMLDLHNNNKASATILTAELEDPAGYGRIMRNADGSVRKIVEDRDATEQEKAVKEVNSGIYVFNRNNLFESLKYITPQNSQKEYYLTDVFEYFWKKGWKICAYKTDNPIEILGVNTIEQLERLSRFIGGKT